MSSGIFLIGEFGANSFKEYDLKADKNLAVLVKQLEQNGCKISAYAHNQRLNDNQIKLIIKSNGKRELLISLIGDSLTCDGLEKAVKETFEDAKSNTSAYNKELFGQIQYCNVLRSYSSNNSARESFDTAIGECVRKSKKR